MHTPTFTRERELIAAGHTVIGVDEAGCGCLAGPVVAAAVRLPIDSRLALVRDSKLLSAEQRERLFMEFERRGYRWAVGIATHEEIDAVNIRQATYLAMRRAVRAWLAESRMMNNELRSRDSSDPMIHDSLFMMQKRSTSNVRSVALKPFCLIDAWHVPGLPIPQRGIIHGDRLVKSIAAASIIAKVTRDRMMMHLDREFPAYGFARHKGYATAAHRAAIAQWGPSRVHRLTFLPDIFQNRDSQNIATLSDKMTK